jgi:Glycosyl hydrolase 2 galactose-binding domain-like/Exo-beta-D-glucosaminidase Ig-fold domain/NedA-like, galactose-binding domain/Glycosyl hydrolases family 2
MRPELKKTHFSFFNSYKSKCLLLVAISILAVSYKTVAQQYNYGIGIYPGDPKENFAPDFKIDSTRYRNLASFRPVYQSSSYDYNLTAQLITDGIVDTTLPGWLIVSDNSDGILKRDGREHILDRHESSQQSLEGPNAWIQVEMAGNYDIPPVDSFSLSGTVIIDTSANPRHWEITINGSNDGTIWKQLGGVGGNGLAGEDALDNLAKRFHIDLSKIPSDRMAFIRRFAPANRRILHYSFKPDREVHYKYYRLNLDNGMAKNWTVSDLTMYDKGVEAPVGGPYHFTSAWKSAGSGREWVYVDLGARCTFDKIKLDWIRRAKQGSIQVSDDAVDWKDIAALKPTTGNHVEIKFYHKIKARYVRVLMIQVNSESDGYILSEMEVFGVGGPVPEAHRQKRISTDGIEELSGGGWKFQRASLVKADGELISRIGFRDNNWLIATVPSTTLVSYLNDGALADPNFGENQFLVSDSYFYSDFWYRDEFIVPASYKGKKTYLNFDGINWEAEVYLNGHDLGQIDGAFIRGKFDVSGILKPGGKNVIAVKIIKNDTPGFTTEQNRVSPDANGGELGADNPTFHASVGWDWIPTIRGRDCGIWNKVYISESGPVTITDPLVTSTLPLPDTSSASIRISLTLTNHSAESISGKLVGRFGNVMFRKPVALDAYSTQAITLDSSNNPVLKIDHPMLWWPNRYGNQNLYKVQLIFITADGKNSDEKTFETGIREMSYTEKDGALRIYVNGKRIVPFGGNWGFSEDMLRYRKREYDIAVRYHKEMNFTMIRNWVGQIGDEAFYNACDKYGIMVWQDLWLANPADGPDPIHPQMFIKNMVDYVKRIRNHPCIGIYVGRNEGNPPPVIQDTIAKELPSLAPGIRYIPNSAFGTVSGGGPYGLMPLKTYFENKRALTTLHSEMGMPDIVTYESFKRMMPRADIWPQSIDWGLHDFTLEGAQMGANFNKAIDDAFGKIDSLREWLSVAHWVEYQGYRAMFEAEAQYRMGLLLWMSHPAWPSLTWQTYDYYLEPTAAYFASKRACEPIHILWNPASDNVDVVNYAVANGNNLSVSAQVTSFDGRILSAKEASLNCPEDSTVSLFPIIKPEGYDSVYFVKLELKKDNRIISRNLYLRGASQDAKGGFGDLRPILNLPQIKLSVTTKVIRKGDQWALTSNVKNATKYPAFNLRLKVVGAKDRKRILPVIYSDNYITLLPGEQRTINMQLQNADTRGEKPEVIIEGLNVK